MANRRYIDFPIASTSGDTDIILIWQDGANKQTTKATFLSGLPENLEDLNDVVISGLTNGQILRYDSVTGKWENTDQGNLDLNDLNDVSIVSPSNGQVLVYNSSTSKWENSSGGFVPYVGAVTTVDLGAQGLRAGYVRFDTTVAGVPNEQGLMFWDADDETVDIILNGYTMKIGEDLFYPVKNQTGSTIAKGVAVRFNGTVGASGRLLIAPFIADGSVPSSRFMGVTAEEILNGEDGKVLYFGRIRGINTNAFNEGDILYASTTVAGGYQTAIPVAPNNIVQVAAVVTKSATVGTIFVRPTLGSNINKDEGVKIVSVADKNLLQYQSGTSLWENKSLAQVLGGTSAQFVKGDGSLDSTSYGTGTVTSVGLSSATSGVTIGSSPVTTSGTITLAIATASGSQNGLLSSTDWTTFNSKQNALTNPVTGTGTTNYLPKFTGASTIGNSQVFDDGTNVGIGTITPGSKFDVTNTVGTAYDASNTLVSGQTMRIANLSTSSSIASTLLFIATGGGGGNGLGTISGVNTATGSLALTFGTRDSGGSVTERARITSGGNLLVGTTTDNGAKFQVNGTVKINTPNRNFFITSNSYSISDSVLSSGIGMDGDGLYLGNVAGSTGWTIANPQLTIRSSGNVGIGTASPVWMLEVNKDTTSGSTGVYPAVSVNNPNANGYGAFYFYQGINQKGGIEYFNGDSTFRIYNSGEKVRITSSGNVLIGTTTEAAGVRLRVEGGVIRSLSTYDNTVATAANLVVSAGGTFERSTSSLKYKKEVRNYDKGLEVLKNMRPVYYKGKSQSDGNKQFAGLIAEEIHELGLNEFVQYANDGTPDALAYTHMVAILINSIKELKQEIDTLKN